MNTPSTSANEKLAWLFSDGRLHCDDGKHAIAEVANAIKDALRINHEIAQNRQ